MEDDTKTTLQQIPYRVSIAMLGVDCAQAAAAVARCLPGGQVRKDDEGTWLVDDCLERIWAVIDGADNIDAMFEKPRDRCVLVSPLLAYEDMDDLLCLLREVRSATGVEGGPSCGMRVYAFLGEGNWLAKVNLRNLFCSKRALLFKALETDLEAFRPGAQERIDRIVFGEEGLCEVFPYDAASSLDPDEARATLQLALAAAAQAVNQERVSAKPGKAENERYAFRCWMVRMGLIGDEYKSMRRRFLKRLPGDSATKAPRVSRENIENLTPLP